jgi:hypothetical protein
MFNELFVSLKRSGGKFKNILRKISTGISIISIWEAAGQLGPLTNSAH